MANLEHNHKCIVCGNTYYACKDCDAKQAIFWRSICCSTSHYQAYHILAQWRDKEITKDEAQTLLISVGIDPQKDIPNFVESAKCLAQEIFKEDNLIPTEISVEQSFDTTDIVVEEKSVKKKTKSTSV